MRHTLHVINGSHPCAAVLRALELKGIDVRIVEYLLPFHPPLLKLRFGYSHVPVLVLPGGEVIRGSRPIMQRLEAVQPEPPLYPREHIQAIEEAERWGDEVLQMAARRLLWTAVGGSPKSLSSFQAGSRLPGLPGPIIGLIAPAVVAAERRMHGVTPERVREAASSLTTMFDRIEEFHAAGAFGTSIPTGADLQIGASLQLIRAIDDLRPLVDRHEHAREIARWLPTSPGRVPGGAFPAEYLELAVSS